MSTVFLTNEGGLTSTSANHLANLAKEACREYEAALNKVSFVDVDLQLIGSSEKLIYKKGLNSVSDLDSKIKRIAELKSFCAWIREAIKSKETMLTTIEKITVVDYEKLTGKICPERPELQTLLTEEDVVKSMSIKDRNNYLRLEALAAAYGKYIHPDGSIAEARNTMYDYINNPITKEFDGRDTILYYRSPSVDPSLVEQEFMALQAEHRNYEKQLNAIKFKIKEEVAEANRKRYEEFNNKLAEYKIEYQAYIKEMELYITNTREEISKLKIVIPDKLKSIYEYLESL